MSELALLDTSDAWLGPLTLRVDVGLTVVTGTLAPPLARLSEIAAGERRPRRGRVLLDGRTLREGSVRRRIAALLPEEELISARSVRQALAAALALRGLDLAPEALLEASGLQQLLEREPHRLDPLERRAVALSLALLDTQAEAVVLYDPFSAGSLLRPSFVLDTCLERARTRAVLIVTPYLEDAMALGGQLFVLERGQIMNTTDRPFLPPFALSVRSQDARRLAALLAVEPHVLGIAFDEQRAPFELLAKGPDLEALASSMVRIACEHSIPIVSIVATPAPPEPEGNT